MDVSEQVAFWRTSAREDFEAACELVEAGRTRHGMFFAHLAIEKALKAHVCMRTSRVPPRVHNLVRLAEFPAIAHGGSDRSPGGDECLQHRRAIP